LGGQQILYLEEKKEDRTMKKPHERRKNPCFPASEQRKEKKEWKISDFKQLLLLLT